MLVLILSSLFCGKSEANQELIMAEGGITLLSMTASDAEDPQTLRMVAGAIANLCGNGTFCCFVASHLVFLLHCSIFKDGALVDIAFEVNAIHISINIWFFDVHS